MWHTNRDPEVIRAELEEKKARYEFLRNWLYKAEALIAKRKVEMRNLSSWGGEIRSLQDELKCSLEYQADQKRRIVVFSDGVDEGNYCVDSVSKSMFCIRRVGEDRCLRYRKADGKPLASYRHAVDMAATFPEGVDAYAAAHKD